MAPPSTGVPIEAHSGTGSPLATSSNLTQLSYKPPILFRMGASHKRICYRSQSSVLKMKLTYITSRFIFFLRDINNSMVLETGDKEEL